MQDRYAGDVGDFSKFAFMRQLERLSQAPIGLIWYKHPDESHNGDGRHTRYVLDRRWMTCDQPLCEYLHGLLSEGKRSVADLELLDLFTRKAKYYSVPCHSLGATDWSRSEWFSAAKEAVRDCQIVFVDPDNGIRLVPRAKPSPKHIELSELLDLAEIHPVTVSYHHFDRSQSHGGQMELLRTTLHDRLPTHRIEIVRYRRISPRAYVCIVHPDFLQDVNDALNHITTGDWAFHFERHVARSSS